MANIKVTVIVPMYGVEKYVGKCADSLLSQTLKEIEVLFINDATKDNSVAVVEESIRNHTEFAGKVRVINHEQNKGLPAARNTGLAAAMGEYVFHCDGDDWMESDALELMYETAKANDADYVWCDWFLSYESTERVMLQANYESKDAMVRNGLLGCGMKYNVWNKLVKRDLYSDNGISFPDGRPMGEDMTMIMLGACAKTVAHCAKPLYHYIRINTGAMTQSLSEKKLDDIKFNVARMEAFLKDRFSSEYDKELSWFKMNVKLPLLLECGKEMYPVWTAMYPEASSNGLDNPNVSFRTRILEWCACRRLWFVITAYKSVFSWINKMLFEK